MFPLTDLDVSIRQAPLDFENVIGADGQGWSDLLNECLSLRANDGAASNTYYYCAVRPSDDPVDFCARGCVAGLGPVPSASDTFNRAAIGLLYENGVDTFVHEIGHTLGLSHAPCGGVSGADPDFPYSSGGIGVLGFDTAAQRLFDTQHRDVMGYCGPVWISDYNYALLYDRLVSVTASSATALKRAATPLALRPVIIDVDGTLSIGETIWIDSAPLGEILMVEWVDESGKRAELSATLVRVSHLPGGILYVPELANPPASDSCPRIRNRYLPAVNTPAGLLDGAHSTRGVSTTTGSSRSVRVWYLDHMGFTVFPTSQRRARSAPLAREAFAASFFRPTRTSQSGLTWRFFHHCGSRFAAPSEPTTTYDSPSSK